MTGIPEIMYEVVVLDGKLFINPSLGVEYNEPTKENRSRFKLPSTHTQFGAILWDFYENNLKNNLPNSDSILKFARSKLEESLLLAGDLTQKIVEDFETKVMESYDDYSLPKNELFKEEEFDLDARKNVATQYVEHVLGEALCQPVRKVYALFCMTEDPETKKQLMEMIKGYIPKYEEMLKSEAGIMPQIVKKKVGGFGINLEKMLKGETLGL